jgi:hypothetical protein
LYLNQNILTGFSVAWSQYAKNTILPKMQVSETGGFEIPFAPAVSA